MKKSASDDLDFWLSTSKPIDSTDPIEMKEKKSKSKRTKSSKKTENNDDEKKSKKKSKKEKDSLPNKSVTNTSTDLKALSDNTNLRNNSSLIKIQDSLKFNSVAMNKTIEISSNIKPNFMNLNQLVLLLELKNLSKTEQIFSIELNILDTANISLLREESTENDSLKINFTLDAENQNQVEYLFNITECTFPQVLKGNSFKLIIKEFSFV